jgi:hypothetical protein
VEIIGLVEVGVWLFVSYGISEEGRKQRWIGRKRDATVCGEDASKDES